MEAVKPGPERAATYPADGRTGMGSRRSRRWNDSRRRRRLHSGRAAPARQVAWHGLDRTVRQAQLREWAGLAADAAASAVLADHPDSAVELLEQGRSLLWAQALMLRSDLSRLAAAAPGLAQRLDSIRMFLASPVHQALPAGPGSADDAGLARRQREATEARKRKAREWDELIVQVHALDGFEHFLSITPYPDLAPAADGGPVVIVNASGHGCHALIAEAGVSHPQVINLPLVSLSTAADRANTMTGALQAATDTTRSLRQREQDRRTVLDVLDWLWEAIAEPVLSALGHTTPPVAGQPWPRIWWCPTGPLTMLPLHAAGAHPRGQAAVPATDCTLDRVTSSYTSTLAALARARQPGQPAPVRQLTVALPETAGQLPLPAAREELIVLARHFPLGHSSQQLAGPQAPRAAALAALATCSWAHFACHAWQQPADPDRSGFALWDSPLTIADLATEDIQRHDLAFLSACQTATGSMRHLDEAIHIAAAMQFLGYRHVIATMWTIADAPAPAVADAVYTKLTEHGSPDPHHAAAALHEAGTVTPPGLPRQPPHLGALHPPGPLNPEPLPAQRGLPNSRLCRLFAGDGRLRAATMSHMWRKLTCGDGVLRVVCAGYRGCPGCGRDGLGVAEDSRRGRWRARDAAPRPLAWHGCHERTVADVPVDGRRVRVRATVRGMRCRSQSAPDGPPPPRCLAGAAVPAPARTARRPVLNESPGEVASAVNAAGTERFWMPAWILRSRSFTWRSGTPHRQWPIGVNDQG